MYHTALINNPWISRNQLKENLLEKQFVSETDGWETSEALERPNKSGALQPPRLRSTGAVDNT